MLQQAKNGLCPRVVLIVDADPSERKRLCSCIQDTFLITEADDAPEALRILHDPAHAISAVLTEHHLPSMKICAFLKQIKSDPEISSIPVMVRSATPNEEEELLCLDCGAADYLNHTLSPEILKHKIQNNIRVKELARSLSEIERDEMTGLYTRPAFFVHVAKLLEQNPDRDYDLVLSDIENFKVINSIYGSATADRLLIDLADFALQHTPLGICARYGVDQIIGIFESSDPDYAKRVELMSGILHQISSIPNVVLKFGIYERIDHSLPVSAMCNQAAAALESVKHNFATNFAKYSDAMGQKLLKARIYESRFQEAIASGEFVLWYQPKYNPYTDKIVGAEALVRWNTPDGLLSPGVFLPVFEQNGLIGQLDEYVFRGVCRQQKKWKDRGRPLIPISVNLSRFSMHRSGTPEKYKKIITEYDLPPSCIPIEITESAAIDSLELQPIAETFHNAGFHLHMDDFGSGHSSLNGLNLLHFDVVKLDKSLIDGIGDHRGDLVLTYTIALAKELGVQVIAEGVEHRKQLDFLKENECDSIQGYFYAKPLPPESFEQYVAANLDAHTQHHNRRPKYTLTPIQDALKWAMDHMIHSMPGGFFTYEATGEERILSSNRYVWELFGCESESEFMEHVHGSFKGFVAPEQLEQVERSIRSQIQNTPNQMDYVEYEIIRKDGSRLLIVDYGHLTGPSTDVFYVFISEADRLFER